MKCEVVMPKMGEETAEGTITRWLKKVGERVKRDEPLFEISTDKVDAEIPSPATGTLLQIVFQEGETVLVNQVVAHIGEASEESSVNTPSKPSTSQSERNQGSRIFISYRREDSEGQTGRLYDGLCLHFGKDKIFMDIDSIELGEDFVEVIEHEVGCCDILIAIIGKAWLNSTDTTGCRRLDNPEDFVRLEIAIALERNIRVIPVLVQGAAMPNSKDLPEAILKLTRRNALELSSTRWEYDMGRLIQVMEKILGPSKSLR